MILSRSTIRVVQSKRELCLCYPLVNAADTTSYVWDVAAGLPVILQDGTNTYVYGLGLISTYDGTSTSFLKVV
jgi:hypothetical protein